MSRLGAAPELRAAKKLVVLGDEGSDPFEALEVRCRRAVACPAA